MHRRRKKRDTIKKYLEHEKQRNEQIWNLGNKMIPPEINAFCGELRATCRQEIKIAIKRATSSLKWWRTKPACHQHARSWLDRHDLIAVPTDEDGVFASFAGNICRT